MFGYRSIFQELPRPAVVRESPRAPWLAVGVVCFGAFMGQLDASIVTITFPAMEHDFGVPVAAVQWVSLVSMARGIDTTLGISLMALALHLGDAGPGYAGSTQARPAFIVLAVVSAAAAVIALAGQAQAAGQAGRDREADPSGGFS